MASAACSSTCISSGELFARHRELRKETRPSKLFGGCELSSSVIMASYASVHGLLCVTRKRHLFPVKTVKEKVLEPVWMNFQMPAKPNFKGWYIEIQCRHLSRVVATVQPFCFITSESGFMDDSNPDCQIAQSSVDFPERETLRRIRISKANKGNVPWNKGKKHSPETIQKIRERTRLAMQDPKVRRKLVKLGHAQSDETKKKIAEGVIQSWRRRREFLIVQEKCILEWKNMIADASRKGYAGDVELQWDSYKLIDEQLKQAWLESIQKRKSMPRPKGSKRAPKSLEQRRKISEAISAKWADPEYRDRVHTALAKYHGTTVGAEKNPRRKSALEKRVFVKKIPERSVQSNIEVKKFMQETSGKRRTSSPSYKDPMSSAKLELLKKIKAERAEMETKKREATMRAKLLIAEAEKAAKALEEAALKSPLAKASLLETRKLIAEAQLSIKSIESGQLKPRENVVESNFNNISDESKKHLQTNMTSAMVNEHLVNGFHNLSSVQNGVETNQFELKCQIEVQIEADSFKSAQCHLPPVLLVNERIESNRAETIGLYQRDLDSRKPNDLKFGLTRTKKWVCGRFVEVED